MFYRICNTVNRVIVTCNHLIINPKIDNDWRLEECHQCDRPIHWKGWPGELRLLGIPRWKRTHGQGSADGTERRHCKASARQHTPVWLQAVMRHQAMRRVVASGHDVASSSVVTSSRKWLESTEAKEVLRLDDVLRGMVDSNWKKFLNQHCAMNYWPCKYKKLAI